MQEENKHDEDFQSSNHPNKSEQKKIDKAKSNLLKSEAGEKDWKFTNFVVAIAIILPPVFWLWPEIKDKWIPDNKNIVIICSFIVFIAILLKLKRFLRDLEGSSDIDIISGKKLSAERESISLSVNFEGKGLEYKPLTKSNNVNFASSGKGAYRHESKMKNDEDSLLNSHPITNWGGSESSDFSNSMERGSVKKAPKR